MKGMHQFVSDGRVVFEISAKEADRLGSHFLFLMMDLIDRHNKQVITTDKAVKYQWSLSHVEGKKACPK
jgi:hypothetical protein